MREAVQLGAAAEEVVDVADIARAPGTNRATEAQNGAVFIMVASVGKVISVSKIGRSIDISNGAASSTNGPAYLYSRPPRSTR